MKKKTNSVYLKQRAERKRSKKEIKNSKKNQITVEYDYKPVRLPVRKSDDILLDSMMISHILIARNEYDENDDNFRWLDVKFNLQTSKNIVKKIQKTLHKYNSKLILLDRVEQEIINMKKYRYSKLYTEKDIEDALFEIGNYEKIIVDYSNKEIIDAERLYQTKTYVNKYNDEPLSPVDCILLKVHVTQALLSRPASLLTSDSTLQNATLSEGRRTWGIDGIGIRFGDKEEIQRIEEERLEAQGIEDERLKEQRMEQERLEEQRMEQERLEEQKNKLRIIYCLCSKCKISYVKGNKCPNCKK